MNKFNILNTLYFLAIGLLLSACAGPEVYENSRKGSLFSPRKTKAISRHDKGTTVQSPLEVSRKSLDNSSELSAAEQIENLSIEDVIQLSDPNTKALYDDSRYDFPITMNSRVEGWIDYFTGRGRRHMERYLSRSSRYIPLMKKIFRDSDMPEDLVYVALIESGFNMRARSRARAVGPWQFIAGTGRRYGLHIDFWVDERRDFIRSTKAASKYLKDLYLMFESWYLAAAAYNAGEYKILRAIDRLKTNNFWAIAKTRHIRRETRDYVPKLISAAIIAKNPEKFGFEDVVYQEPIQWEEVTIQYPLHLKDIAKLIGCSNQELLDLNPELRRGMVPPKSKAYVLRIPPDTKTLVTQALASNKNRYRKPVLPYTVKVRWGDTLYGIARKFGVSIAELREVNNLGRRRSRIYPGMKLIVPTEDGKPHRKVAAKRSRSKSKSSAKSKKASSKFITHIVRRGESLWSIAEKYNVTVQKLFRWNRLRRSRIYPGKRLKVKPVRQSERNNSSSVSRSRSKLG